MIDIGDQSYEWQAGMTVAQLLNTVPGGDDCAVVRLNGRLVSRPNFGNTIVPDRAEIVIIPMIAGG